MAQEKLDLTLQIMGAELIKDKVLVETGKASPLNPMTTLAEGTSQRMKSQIDENYRRERHEEPWEADEPHLPSRLQFRRGARVLRSVSSIAAPELEAMTGLELNHAYHLTHMIMGGVGPAAMGVMGVAMIAEWFKGIDAKFNALFEERKKQATNDLEQAVNLFKVQAKITIDRQVADVKAEIDKDPEIKSLKEKLQKHEHYLRAAGVL